MAPLFQGFTTYRVLLNGGPRDGTCELKEASNSVTAAPYTALQTQFYLRCIGWMDRGFGSVSATLELHKEGTDFIRRLPHVWHLQGHSTASSSPLFSIGSGTWTGLARLVSNRTHLATYAPVHMDGDGVYSIQMSASEKVCTTSYMLNSRELIAIATRPLLASHLRLIAHILLNCPYII